MKLLLIADIEDNCWTGGSGEADTLLSCGDVPDTVILEAAHAYDCTRVYAAKGNHDMPNPFPEPVIDLQLRVDSFGGISFGGFNGSWRYKPRGPCSRSPPS